MPAPYGVTPTGFNAPTVEEIIALNEADEHAEIDDQLDVSSDSLVGQLNAIYARHLALAWEALRVAYHSNDPDQAEGFALLAIAKLTGTRRRSGSRSTVTLSVVLEEGTTLESGLHFAAIEGDPDNRWTPAADYTAAAAGAQSVLFMSELVGEHKAPAASSWVIATSVNGWSGTPTNAEDAVPGRPPDDDPTLRARREEQIAGAGSATVIAIRAGVSALDDVEKVIVFENNTDATDSNGLPPHSFECIVWAPGATLPEDDNAISQAIWDNKGCGIRAFSSGTGATSGTAVDANGDEHTVPFTRVEEVPLYVTYTLTERASYVGDDEFKERVVHRLNGSTAEDDPDDDYESLGIGDDVTEYDLTVATAGLGALVTAVTFGLAPSPGSSTPVAIGARQIARFDTARVVIA